MEKATNRSSIGTNKSGTKKGGSFLKASISEWRETLDDSTCARAALPLISNFRPRKQIELSVEVSGRCAELQRRRDRANDEGHQHFQPERTVDPVQPR